jgi:hypothetical protein
MEDTRKGFLTPDQEKQLDELIELKGLYESMDGTAIKLADNMVLEKLKAKIPEDVLPIVYEVIDEVFKSLIAISE